MMIRTSNSNFLDLVTITLNHTAAFKMELEQLNFRSRITGSAKNRRKDGGQFGPAPLEGPQRLRAPNWAWDIIGLENKRNREREEPMGSGKMISTYLINRDLSWSALLTAAHIR
jgi:hypothetical protein